MSSLLESFGDGKNEARVLVSGSITRIDGDDVFATIPAFNTQHDFGPIAFEHAGFAAVGDAVLVGFDEQGTPWVAAWRGAAGSDPTAMHTGDAAGGVLSGTYPSPGFAVDMATQAELDAEATARALVATNLSTHAALTTSAHGGIVADTDARLTNARTPSGAAGGDLLGSYPNPNVYRATVQDTRTVDSAPQASLYGGPRVYFDFKQRASIAGTPGAGTFGCLVTLAKWSDDSGGGVTQAWYDDSDPPRMFLRKGTVAGGWSAWQEMAPLASPVFTGNPTAPTPAANDNDTSIATTAFVQGEIGGMGTWTIGTSPPGSPADGDVWVYEGSGFKWMFVYTSAETTYKWKFVGGGALVAAIATDQTYTQGVSFVDATGAGPTVTLPRAGDYEIEFSVNSYVSAQSSSSVIEAAANASSGTWDSTAAGGIGNNGQHYSTGGVPNTISMVDVVRGVSASATVKIQYRSNLGGTAHTRWRLIRARPIRVI